MARRRLHVIAAVLVASLLASCSPSEAGQSAPTEPPGGELDGSIGVDIRILETDPLPEGGRIVDALVENRTLWVLTESATSVALHRMTDGTTWRTLDLTAGGIPPGLGTPGMIAANGESVAVVFGTDLLNDDRALPWIAHGTIDGIEVVGPAEFQSWGATSPAGRELALSRAVAAHYVDERLIVAFEARWWLPRATADYSIVTLALASGGSVETLAADSAPLGGQNTQTVTASFVADGTLYLIGSTSLFGLSQRVIEVWTSQDGLRWDSRQYPTPELGPWLTVHGAAGDGRTIVLQVEHALGPIPGERTTVVIERGDATVIDDGPGAISQVVRLENQFLAGPNPDVVGDDLDRAVWTSLDGYTWVPLGESSRSLGFWTWTPYPRGVLTVSSGSIGYSGPWPFADEPGSR